MMMGGYFSWGGVDNSGKDFARAQHLLTPAERRDMVQRVKTLDANATLHPRLEAATCHSV